MTPPVVETHGLRKRFGHNVAVAGLSLSVEAGEVFGFLGPNGAGKTTSIKMLLGLLEPTSGGGTVLGRPLGDRAARSQVGFLPEHFRFPAWMTGRELLQFHARLLRLDPASPRVGIDRLLSRVDLVDAADRTIGTYSKGMQQRIGLAQAMLGEPRIVFLDEPTSGLDPIGRVLVRDVIRELRVAGTTVVLNSHLLGEVEATCDRVVFVKHGRAVHALALGADDDGVPIELHVDRADAELLAGLARFGDGLEQVNGRVRMRAHDIDRLPEIARFVVGRGAQLYELRRTPKTLETLFLEVMGEGQRPG